MRQFAGAGKQGPDPAPVGRRALATAGGIYLLGALWRVHHLFRAHPATDFVYSDMAGYLRRAREFADSSFVPTIADSLYPPGTHMLFGLLIGVDPSGALVIVLQCLLSLTIPLLVAGIGLELYGRREALLGLVLASLYFPFIDYAGYFLSENPFTFSLYLGTWFLACGLGRRADRSAVAWALAGGVALGASMAFRANALLPAVCAALGLGAVALLRRSRRGGLVTLAAVTGFTLVAAPLAARCTRLAEGSFCLVSTNGGLNVLMGHYGDLRVAEFVDPVRGFRHEFLLPVAYQMPERFRTDHRFDFGAYESDRALGLAREWVSEHPAAALRLSLAHVRHLFGGSVPWPTSGTPSWELAAISQVLFLRLIALPAGLCLLVSALPRGPRSPGARRADLALLLPLLGLVATAFIVHGSPRLRIPFDGFFILLAASAYVAAWSLLEERIRAARGDG